MYKILLRSHSKLVNATKMDHGDETFRHNMSLFCCLRHMVTKYHLSHNIGHLANENFCH